MFLYKINIIKGASNSNAYAISWTIMKFWENKNWMFLEELELSTNLSLSGICSVYCLDFNTIFRSLFLAIPLHSRFLIAPLCSISQFYSRTLSYVLLVLKWIEDCCRIFSGMNLFPLEIIFRLLLSIMGLPNELYLSKHSSAGSYLVWSNFSFLLQIPDLCLEEIHTFLQLQNNSMISCFRCHFQSEFFQYLLLATQLLWCLIWRIKDCQFFYDGGHTYWKSISTQITQNPLKFFRIRCRILWACIFHFCILFCWALRQKGI